MIVVDVLVVVLVVLQSGQAEGHGLGGGNAELGELGGVSASSGLQRYWRCLWLS